MTQYGILITCTRQLLSRICLLSDAEISEIEKLCFDYASTTVLPNSQVTYKLLDKCYKLLVSDRCTSKQIVENFQYWMMMPI